MDAANNVCGKSSVKFQIECKNCNFREKNISICVIFSHLATQSNISHGWGPALGAQTSFSHIFQLIHVTQKVDAFFQIFRFVNWPNVHLRTENEDLYTHFLILFNWYLSQNLHIVCVHLSTLFLSSCHYLSFQWFEWDLFIQVQLAASECQIVLLICHLFIAI